jgi:methyl-accepting chemotaxis protein
MAGNISRRLALLISADPDQALAAFRKVGGAAKRDLGDAEDKIEALAQEFEQAALDMVSRAEKIENAASALGNALGPELAAKVDTRQLVQDFERMGASLDETAAGADRLADAVRKMDSAADGLKQGGSLNSGVADLDGKMQKLHSSSDQSRSVLANMAGNTAQDLGAISGAAGSAGVAIGQLAEYAADGNISMGGLAKVAGPMIALSAAGFLAAKAFEEQRKKAEELRKEQQALRKVAEALAEGNDKLAAQTLADTYEDDIAAAKKYGVTMGEFVDSLNGGTDAIAKLNAKLDDKGVRFSNQETEIKNLIGVLERSNSEFDKQKQKVADNAATADEFRQELTGLSKAEIEARDATKDTTEAFSDQRIEAQDLADAIDNVRQRTEDATDAMIDAEASALDVADGFDEAAKANKDLADGVTSGDDAMRDARRTTLGLKNDVLEYTRSVLGVPDSAVTEILALIDQGKLDEAKWALAELEKDRQVKYKVKVDFSDAPIKPDGGGDVKWRSAPPQRPGTTLPGAPPSVQPQPQYQITVNAGLGANGEQIAAEIDRLLRTYRQGTR